MTLHEMQMSAAVQQLETALEKRDSERTDMRQALVKIHGLLSDTYTARSHVLMILEQEMERLNIVVK